MKLKHFTLTLLAAISLTAQAANEQQTVAQCTDGISLTTPIDYIITGTNPFATTGAIDTAPSMVKLPSNVVQSHSPFTTWAEK